MALPRNINTLEVEKFTECEGDVAVRTYLCGDTAFRPSGLNTAGRILEVTLNSSTWTPLPSTPLINRNAISIQNVSAIEIKINYSDSVSGYVGTKISNGSERFYDITDNIVIYAKSASGTPTIIVEEIS